MKLEEFLSADNFNRLKKEDEDKRNAEAERQKLEMQRYAIKQEKEYQAKKPFIKMYVEEVLLPLAEYKDGKIVLPYLEAYSNTQTPSPGYNISKDIDWKDEYSEIRYDFLSRYLKEAIPGADVKVKTEEVPCGPDYNYRYYVSCFIDPSLAKKETESKNATLKK